MPKLFTIVLPILLWLQGCSSMQVNTSKPSTKIEKNATFAIAPFYNYTQTPLAGFRAAALANAVARVKGFQSKPVGMQPKEGMLDDNLPKRVTLQEQAKTMGARYLLTGEVTEWRYKTGIDGEPAVGLVVEIIDTHSGKTVYTGAGSQSGWGHKSISVIAQSVLEEIIP